MTRVRRDPTAEDWLDAFQGIPAYPTVPGGPDLTTVLSARRSIRSANVDAGAILHVGSLRLIAERIDSLSRQLTEALGGDPSRPLDADTLAAYEAQEKAAEDARSGPDVRTGTLVHDPAEDSNWSALYDAAGRLVEQGHGSNVLHSILTDGWAVNVVDAEGLLYDWDARDFEEDAPGLSDWQEFPPTLAAVTGRLAINARKAKLAEHVAALDAEEEQVGDVDA